MTTSEPNTILQGSDSEYRQRRAAKGMEAARQARSEYLARGIDFVPSAFQGTARAIVRLIDGLSTTSLGRVARRRSA